MKNRRSSLVVLAAVLMLTILTSGNSAVLAQENPQSVPQSQVKAETSCGSRVICAHSARDRFCGGRRVANPLRSYSSLAAMEKVLGFTPLTLPPEAPYKISGLIIINDRVANIDYTSTAVNDTHTFTVRSALREKAGRVNISGYYPTTPWHKEKIGRTKIYTAALSPNNMAAYWHQGQMVYAASSKNTDHETFYAQLQNLAAAVKARAK